jgi:hypothetical protein
MKIYTHFSAAWNTYSAMVILGSKQAGLEGEDKEIYTLKGLGNVQWKPAQSDQGATWYKVSGTIT